MNRYLLLFLVLLIGRISHAQTGEDDYQKAVDAINKDFSEIMCDFADLVPFPKGDKWGYLDRNTKKTMVEAKYHRLGFFNPDMNEGQYNGFYFFVKRSRKVEVLIETNIDIGIAGFDDVYPKIKIISSETGFKGFSTDAKGNLLSYSDLYHYYDDSYRNVHPFKTKNGYLGIVKNKKGECAIIDTAGNALKGFDFNDYRYIRRNDMAKDTLNDWFYVTKNGKDWSLINDKGDVRFKDELIAAPSGGPLGLAEVSNGSLCGLWDGYEMKWIVKPQTKIKRFKIEYSSKKAFDNNKTYRKNAHMYYMTDSPKQKYYKDLDGNMYMPKR